MMVFGQNQHKGTLNAESIFFALFFSLFQSACAHPDRSITIRFDFNNHDRLVYVGRGHEANPFLFARNSRNPDFSDAHGTAYDFKSKRIIAAMSKDSTEKVWVNSLEPFEFNEWYHIVTTYLPPSLERQREKGYGVALLLEFS